MVDDNNCSDYSNIGCIIDREKGDVFLYLNNDGNKPGIIHAKLGGLGSVTFFGNRFKGSITIVEPMTFELPPKGEKKVSTDLLEKPAEETTKNIKESAKGDVIPMKYELYNPETDAGKQTPTQSLSRRLKKKWHKEREHYENSMKIVHSQSSEGKTAEKIEKQFVKPEPKTEIPKSKVQELAEDKIKEAKDTNDSRSKKEKEAEKKLKIGAGNAYGTFADIMEGYFLGRYIPKENKWMIVKTDEDQNGIRYPLTFEKERAAKYVLNQLLASESFGEIIQGMDLVLITKIRTEDLSKDCAIIRNGATFLQTL